MSLHTPRKRISWMTSSSLPLLSAAAIRAPSPRRRGVFWGSRTPAVGPDPPRGRRSLPAPPIGARRVPHPGGYSLILSPLTNMAAWISNSEELVSWKTEICIVWPFQTKNYMYAGHSDMQRMKGQGTSGWFTWFIQWKSVSFDSYWSGDCRGSSCLFCVYQYKPVHPAMPWRTSRRGE